jgi:hypothetical protein
MSTATELVLTVEALGGRFLVDGAELVIRPGDAAMPLLKELRANKLAIIAFLQSRTEQQPDPDNDGLGLCLLDRCLFRDHSWSGVAPLHLDRSRWCAEHGRAMPRVAACFCDGATGGGLWGRRRPGLWPPYFGQKPLLQHQCNRWVLQ